MFWKSIRPLLTENSPEQKAFDQLPDTFSTVMAEHIEKMWAAKLGIHEYNKELLGTLLQLMHESEVDYTIFFRELSHIPNELDALNKSFYKQPTAALQERWDAWLKEWHQIITNQGNVTNTSTTMKQTNPKYTWREWLIVPAYQQAAQGDYSLIKELQGVFNNPYGEQSAEIEAKYYQLKPKEFFDAGGVSHYSCSS